MKWHSIPKQCNIITYITCSFIRSFCNIFNMIHKWAADGTYDDVTEKQDLKASGRQLKLVVNRCHVVPSVTTHNMVLFACCFPSLWYT